MEDTLKIMFVDDEHLVRVLLKNCINWGEIGYQVVGEAANAHEALEMLETLNPDVIFTDINMPFMDGLEFGRIVFEKYTHIKIVILTGYEEFEYAKRGIKIGISDFLLKPVNDDEIRKTAMEIRAKILAERNEQDEVLRIRKQLEDNMPFLREKTLNELLTSSLDAEELQNKAKYFQIKLSADHVQVAAIEASLAGSETSSNEEERLLLRIQCRDLVDKYFRDDHLVHVFFDNNQFVIVLCSDRSINLDECMTSIHTMLINKLKCYVCIGLGNIYDHLQRTKTSYREAILALQYKIVIGNNCIINYDDIRLATKDTQTPDKEPLEELAFYLRIGIHKKVREILASLFSDLGSHGERTRLDGIRALATTVLSIVLNVVAESGVNLAELLQGNSQPFERIFEMDTLPEIRQYLAEIAEKTMAELQGLQTKKEKQVISQVKNYVVEHLADPELTLSGIARTHFINMSYLSRIFKQETGQNFVEYLTQLRMEKAVKLLKETDMKSYQVAEAVGIVNPHYFGICFKKWTGVSVSDFKKQ
jgi:two-component system, response regulator YesN